MIRLLIDVSICIDVDDDMAMKLGQPLEWPIPQLEADFKHKLKAHQVDILNIEEETKPSTETEEIP